MKKNIGTILMASLCLFTLSGCGGGETPAKGETSTANSVAVNGATDTANKEYTLNYPANMQESGFTDPVVLPKKPTRVVAITVSPVLTLHNIGIELIAIPSSLDDSGGALAEWPADLVDNAEVINTSFDAFDIETIVALSPDLVFLGQSSADTYGKILTDAKIPVYYVNAGHGVSYHSTKALTFELLASFGENSEAAKKIETDYADLEVRLEKSKIDHAGRSVMVLQSRPPSHFLQTPGATLASMLDMMGFANVYEGNEGSYIPLDFEQAISYDPDIFFAIASGGDTAEKSQEIMEADYANNLDYWNSIEALKNGNTIYMPTSYISSTGIDDIVKINELMDMIEEYDTREKQ